MTTSMPTTTGLFTTVSVGIDLDLSLLDNSNVRPTRRPIAAYWTMPDRTLVRN